MKPLRFLLMPLLAASLLLIAAGMYSTPVAFVQQNERSAHSKKPTSFHYVCPMHEDVTSKTRGTCRKCKMKLVKKPIVVKEPVPGSN